MNFKVTARGTDDNESHISVNLEVSPSDMPYTACLKEENNLIHVELIYLNEESKKIKMVSSNDCTVELGDNTGRIYSIIIDGNHLKTSCINNRIFKEKLEWSNRKERFRRNFLLGDNIIRETLVKFNKMKKKEYVH